jgi:DNA modification methylase
VDYGEWDDARPRQDYLEFTREWLDACIRVLSDQGSLWVNIPDDTAAEVVVYLKQCGLVMVNWCNWHFRFGQHRDGNFIVSKVHALYFARDKKNRVWNPSAVLEPSDRAAISDDKRTRETQHPGLRVPLDVWHGPNWGRVQGNNRERRKQHQNQLPEVYLERVILACSNAGQLVLDPFLGSGTTCTVARALGRRSIGIDHSSAYASSAFTRIQEGAVRVGLGRPESNSLMTHRKRAKNGKPAKNGAPNPSSVTIPLEGCDSPPAQDDGTGDLVQRTNNTSGSGERNSARSETLYLPQEKEDGTQGRDQE